MYKNRYKVRSKFFACCRATYLLQVTDVTPVTSVAHHGTTPHLRKHEAVYLSISIKVF